MLHERDPNMMVNREKLIEKLKENRKKHEETYERMCKGYMVLVDCANKEFQAKLKESFKNKKPQDVDHRALYDECFDDVSRPVEHFKDYDEAIELLEWMNDEQVSISLLQFKKWVRDEWDWQNSFLCEGELSIMNSGRYEKRFK